MGKDGGTFALKMIVVDDPGLPQDQEIAEPALRSISAGGAIPSSSSMISKAYRRHARHSPCCAALEHRQPVVSTHDTFPIEIERKRFESSGRSDNRRKPVWSSPRPGGCKCGRYRRASSDHQPISVMFDFVHPKSPAGARVATVEGQAAIEPGAAMTRVELFQWDMAGM